METKRDEFRRYLEKAGVMDALTKVLVGLYEEPDKPNDALMYVSDNWFIFIAFHSSWFNYFYCFRYLKNQLSVAHPDQAELESMRTELQFARRQMDLLT